MNLIELAIIFGLALSAGCGKGVPLPITVDPLLVPYFERFERDVKRSAAGVIGTLAIAPEGDAAICTVDGDGNHIASFDAPLWARSTDNYHEQVVYHELGHCAMNLNHDADRLAATYCPVSIMFPSAFGNDPCYYNNKDYYFMQLHVEPNILKRSIIMSQP